MSHVTNDTLKVDVGSNIRYSVLIVVEIDTWGQVQKTNWSFHSRIFRTVFVRVHKSAAAEKK